MLEFERQVHAGQYIGVLVALGDHRYRNNGRIRRDRRIRDVQIRGLIGLDRLYADVAAQRQAAEFGVDADLHERRGEFLIDLPRVLHIVDAIVGVGVRIVDRVDRLPETIAVHGRVRCSR